MSNAELSVEAQEALAATRLGGLKKKINAAGWSNNMEDLLKSWGEKSAGLRFMHNNAGGYWKGVSNRLTLWGILITTVASTVSLVATNIDDYASNLQKGIFYFVTQVKGTPLEVGKTRDDAGIGQSTLTLT